MRLLLLLIVFFIAAYNYIPSNHYVNWDIPQQFVVSFFESIETPSSDEGDPLSMLNACRCGKAGPSLDKDHITAYRYAKYAFRPIGVVAV